MVLPAGVFYFFPALMVFTYFERSCFLCDEEKNGESNITDLFDISS